MPNHITNKLQLFGEENRIRELLRHIQNKEYSYPMIDFNAIIPMPTVIQISKTAWYDWSIKHWGTKWNAYHFSFDASILDKNSMVFLTAWSAPHPVISRLASLYPDISFVHAWADEDIGQNCGQREYQNGTLQTEYEPESRKAAIEFAADLMDADPENWGLYLNPEGTDYCEGDDF